MLRQSAKALIVSVLVGTSTQAFQVSPTSSSACSRSALHALNRHRLFSHEVQEKSEPNSVSVGPVAALALLAATALSAAPAVAVSGGGLDYAGLDISGQDFSNGNYKGKDFTQAPFLPFLVLVRDLLSWINRAGACESNFFCKIKPTRLQIL